MRAPDETWDQAQRLNVSRESWQRIQNYVELLLRWQSRTNLVSRSSLVDLWQRHVIDSLQIIAHLPSDLTAFADLGSGGGFPGLPLAIATGSHVHLYEANGKKCAFLRQALRETGASGSVHNVRLEDISLTEVPHVQVVTARALAPVSTLLSLSEPFLAAGARGLFHKGQDINSELTEATKSWRIRYRMHQSSSDSRAVILDVEEATRV